MWVLPETRSDGKGEAADVLKNMKSHGNNIVNKIYNPKNVKPPVPTDIDEEDAAMERFIRQKYEHRTLADGKPKPPSRHESDRASRTSEDSPPPLPPKTGKGFGLGLRSGSSHSHRPRSAGRPSSPRSPQSDTYRHESRSPPIPINNKQSRVFGASIGDMSESFEAKLAVLRDMGFPDDRRNATVLRGLNGNLEKTIESLVRLGEGTNPGSRARTPVAKARTGGKSESGSGAKPATSTNPFDQLDSAPSSQPTTKSYNPFDVPVTQPTSTQSLESSFQNLQISKPLFPHSTGGYPSQQVQFSQAPFQQSMTPPVTSQSSFMPSPQPLNSSYNPFFQSMPPQNSGGTNPFGNPAPTFSQTNPFYGHISPQNTAAQPQQPTQGPLLSAFEPQSQSQPATTMPAFASPSPFAPSSQPPQQPSSQTSYNPFNSMAGGANQSNPFFQTQFQPQQSAQFQPQQQGFPSQPQQLTPQPTGRLDKNSILALYNLPPSTMPQQSQQQQPLAPSQQTTAGLSPAPTLTTSLGSTPQTQSSFGLSTPQPTATNPFFTSSPQPTAPAVAAAPSGLGIGMSANPPQQQTSTSPFVKTHSSKASVDINGAQNGRHSPDAFASLSARYQ